jgi:hypothetical protein
MDGAQGHEGGLDPGEARGELLACHADIIIRLSGNCHKKMR